MDPLQYLIAALGAFAAGAVNALAGGGTLITFPLLTAIGLPAVTANVTSTVSLFPGYFGAAFAQRADLKDQQRRLKLFLPAAVIGGLIGGLLLLRTGEKTFRQIVPFLILFASLLLALGESLKKWLTKRSNRQIHPGSFVVIAILSVLFATVYGGYFGAGLSVIVLALLGLMLEDSLTRLNALKQAIALAANSAAAVFFLFSGRVVWSLAGVMALSALLGGVAGGKLAGSISPNLLRWVVVTIGIIVSIIFFIQYY